MENNNINDINKVNNSNNRLSIVLVICVLVILGLIGYICYDKSVFGNKIISSNNVENRIEGTDETIINSSEGTSKSDNI